MVTKGDFTQEGLPGLDLGGSWELLALAVLVQVLSGGLPCPPEQVI